MPLITKASRRGRKPGWQRGVVAPTKAHRDALAIVANHEAKVSRAFNRLLGSVLGKLPDGVRASITSGASTDKTMALFRFFDEKKPDTFAVWRSFARTLEDTYAQVIEESVQNENRNRGWNISIRKGREISMADIPIDSRVAKFIRDAALTRVVDISAKEEERIREILIRATKTGARPFSIIREIQATIGLTTKQNIRLQRKLARLSEEGMGMSAIAALEASEVVKIRRQRANAISRTETNAAQNSALQESWRQADEGGLVEEGTKKKWTAMPYTEGRSSRICQDLNDQQVGLNEDFHSDVEAGFHGQGPPAHPNCRSTLTLVFPDGEDDE